MSEDAPTEAEKAQLELWQFVPLSAYAQPELAARSAAVAAWATFRQLFRSEHKEELVPVRQEDALRALPGMHLEHLVRPIDWRKASAALDAALREPSGDGATGVQFLIGQPHCGHPEIVADWAVRHGAQIIEPPSYEEVLSSKGCWRATWPAVGQAWAIPCLERFFLRSANGLALVRNLLEEIVSGRRGAGLIGCDSWAWAFLQRVSALPLPGALTLQAFDGPRLARLLAQLADVDGQRQLLFRNARSGNTALTVPHDGDTASEEVAQLAAHCRGNVGTARDYWRQRLRAVSDSAVEFDKDKAGTSEVDESDAEVIWVSATQPEPALPVEADEDVALVLHALLIHNGLGDEMLAEVLPLPRHLCMAIVLRLQKLTLLERHEGRWRVSALGYELVRRWLRGRGFLADDF
ncbi:hypothetical protein J5J83_12700 [Azoarcus sp. L1K30]|uniref:hypothetical protein n=1 Tax=Azoarcus sp. L1K30 TaxID=2820277 RepID=UPI001B833D3D|nr:hypothetical protein [Azoarcus sp. L1K30]MBR0566974.1 hypothetical protein [Azoarcus sp. L1K30]